MDYAKLSVPRPLFDQVAEVAAAEGFRSPSEAILTWARLRVESHKRATAAAK